VNFNSDIMLRADFESANTLTVFEIKTDTPRQPISVLTFVRDGYTHSINQSAAITPAYITVPLASSSQSAYIKIEYNSDNNKYIRDQKLSVRRLSIQVDTSGWQNAEKITLSEERTISFKSMNDNKWFKLESPLDTFNYKFDIPTQNNGSFMADVYSANGISNGKAPIFSNCMTISYSRMSVEETAGSGTYYIHLYPTPFSQDIINTEFYFATANDESMEKVTTSFGAQVSKWALEEIEEAYKEGLIPEQIAQRDLTYKVSRGEFAAISLNAYEALSKKRVREAVDYRFTDTEGNTFKSDISKAYGVGIVQGLSETTFGPTQSLTREQAATMLCRVLEKFYTIDRNSPFYYCTNYTPFADDAQISDWAKPSVYTMRDIGVISGKGGNIFAPKNLTAIDEANNYASATREQAILMANRLTKTH